MEHSINAFHASIDFQDNNPSNFSSKTIGNEYFKTRTHSSNTYPTIAVVNSTILIIHKDTSSEEKSTLSFDIFQEDKIDTPIFSDTITTGINDVDSIVLKGRNNLFACICSNSQLNAFGIAGNFDILTNVTYFPFEDYINTNGKNYDFAFFQDVEQYPRLQVIFETDNLIQYQQLTFLKNIYVVTDYSNLENSENYYLPKVSVSYNSSMNEHQIVYVWHEIVFQSESYIQGNFSTYYDPPIPCTNYNDDEKSSDLNIVVVLIISFLGIIGLILLLFVIVVIVLLFFLSKSQKKANRFDHIEGVDMILKEAELDQQQDLPKIKISKSKYIVDFKEISIIKKIGEGASASMVYLCDWNGTQCAFKGFSEGSSLVGTDKSTFTEFEKEVEICVGLNHPGILQFYGASITPKRIGLLIQYCSNGDLKSFIQSKRKIGGYSISEKKRILKEIVSGMDYLHNKKLLHRDLKPENVLLDENEKAKIMDFGLSKTIDNAEEKTMTKMIGTVFYMAPEVIKEDKYSFPCDVYSFGILAYVFLSENFHPYGKNISQQKIMNKVIVDPQFRPEIKKEDFKECEFLIPIIKTCWNFKPEERHTFNKLKEILKEDN